MIHSFRQRLGSISILVLVFGVIFSTTISGLVLTAATQYTASTRTEAFEKALTFAQAGADYYRWHLSHNNTDFTDGTSQPGPYVHEITDPSGENGTFSLTIDASSESSGSAIVTVSSTGWVNSHPDIKRNVTMKFGKPSLAKYAFLLNSNIWFGYRTNIYGKVFSNGGIRMDGTHDSTVQSAKETYTCGTETGCDPAETKPGIWGVGGPQELWEFPVNQIDFNSVVLDFAAMKASAQQQGIYLAPSGSYGYHLTFSSNGTVTVKKITNAGNKKGWSVENGCENLYQDINTEQTVGTYSIADKPIIFAEDDLWVDGVVKGQISVVAAKFPIEINKKNIWVSGNLTYEAKDGTNRTGLIAQNDIYFALDIPTDFEVDAALLAQKGRIIRHNYKYQHCTHQPEAVRQSLYIYGSLISNQRAYWSYGTGPNVGYGQDPTSGFVRPDIIYDPTLYYSPPPYFPSQGEYELISWEER